MNEEPNSSTVAVSRWRVWLTAVLLCVVAMIQIVLAKTMDLSPWKGGGFGMFASLDGTAHRHVRVFVGAPGRSEELAIAPSQIKLADRAKLFPSDPRLSALADSVVAREKRYGRQVTIVRIEIWRSEFNEYLEATDRPLRTFIRDVAGPT